MFVRSRQKVSASFGLPLPKARAMRGVLTTCHVGVRGSARFDNAAKPGNSPSRASIQPNALKLPLIQPRGAIFLSKTTLLCNLQL